MQEIYGEEDKAERWTARMLTEWECMSAIKEVLSLVGEKTETIENGVTIIDDVRDKDS